MTTIGSRIGAGLVIGVLATGCSSTTAPNATPYGSKATSAATSALSAKPVAGPTITISGMAFGAPITVASGATITVVNADGAEHSVTSVPAGSFDTHVDGGAQKTFTAPTQPGTYSFVCVYHPGMKGALIVT